MKSILTDHILPFILALVIVWLVLFSFTFPMNIPGVTDRKLMQPKPAVTENYMPALSHSPEKEEALRNALKSGTLVLLGSSELTESSQALPYRFIPATFGFPVLGLGHAGYQSMAILATLSSMSRDLYHARILIILSPGWFENTSSRGTSMAIFLENISDPMLVTLINSKELPEQYKAYIADYVASQINNITRSSAPYRYLYHLSASMQNIVFEAFHYPFLALNGWWMNSNALRLSEDIRSEQPGGTATDQPVTKVVPPEGYQLPDWDSLIDRAAQIGSARSTTNRWGIEDSHYLANINGAHGPLRPLDPADNRELHDFGMLVRLLQQYDCKATFVIQPINPFYYQPLSILQPTIQAITDTLAHAGFPCLNLFEADTARYQKSLLRDVMHMDDAGWYHINRFITDQYIKHE